MIIETERLIIREIQESDFEAYKKVIGDKENMIHYTDDFDDRKVRHWISWARANYENLGFSLWALELKETGQMIGDCGITIQEIDGLFLPEIGYHIRRDLHLQGLAKEAAIAVRDWAFENTPFARLYSYMTSDNLPSQSTARAYGAKFVKEYYDKRAIKHQVYAISRNEWEELKG